MSQLQPSRVIVPQDKGASGGPRAALQRRTGHALCLAVVLAWMAAQTMPARERPNPEVLLCPACLMRVTASAEEGGTLKQTIVERDAFTVIGIQVRTNNSEAATVIPRQWDRFFREGVPGKISNRTDANLVVVYSGYASDYHGDFDYLIGARVKDGSAAPAGMIVKVVPKARYAVVTTEQGPVGKVVSEAWQKIWNLDESGGLGGRRAYKADFELYDERSRDPNNSQVDIYVGID